MFQETADHVVGQTQGIGLFVAGDDVFLEFRIQSSQLIHADLTYVGDLLEMERARDVDGIRSLGHTHFERTDIVFAIVSHDVVGCNERRHIASGLFRQVIIELPEILFPVGTADGLVDGSRTAVVGSQYQVPVVVNIV